MVIKNNFFIIILTCLFFCKNLYCTQIYDYQTEEFIKELNLKILSVNNYNKKINFKIFNDDSPNAFVTEKNTIFLSSGLLINSPDYISLLAVLAHEIGHIEKYHVKKRKGEINDFEKINSLGNLAVIAGSMLIQSPHLINGIAINQGVLNNLLINFSQDQEKEADTYAANTLNRLKLSTKSVKEFLKILESKTDFDIIDNELKKFSTHPLFQDRYEILDSKKSGNQNRFDQNLQKEFNFIKAKFFAYSDSTSPNNLNGDQLIYFKVIKHSLSGNLLKSLRELNKLISKNNKSFLLETKADILLSYGYNKEALEFYSKVLKKEPQNNYIKFNIFMHSNYSKKSKSSLEEIFLKNQILFNLFPKNLMLQNKFYDLSKKLEYDEWIIFFKILLSKNMNIESNLNKLKKRTKDNNLKKIINLYI